MLKFIFRSWRGATLLMAAAALLSGACNAGLIAVVNHALSTPGRTSLVFVAGFAALGLGRLATSVFSQLISVRFSEGAIAWLRRDLVRGILAAPLRQLEQLGVGRIFVALTDDVYHVAQALLGLPIIAVNLALLLGGAAYLTWLSWRVLLVLLVLVIFGGVGYRLFVRRAFRSLNQAREEEDRLFGHFRALTEGIKELKLHRGRRSLFVSHDIQRSTQAFQNHNIRAENCFIIAQHWSHLLFYILIGAVLFLLPSMIELSPETLSGYVITTLYLMGPLAGVLSSFSLFGRANVALGKIEQLGVQLSTSVAERIRDDAVEPTRTDGFKRLELIGVSHHYYDENDENQFAVGPLSLTFHPGELIFLVGGNGSGKSTLAKVLLGLYPPRTGEIRLDGIPITDATRDEYRQRFSAVFADFFVFDNLAGAPAGELDTQAADYLVRLRLEDKVKVNNGTLSTTALSQGQRKRLALLAAYLEDRPFYLFDEWASDQDPQFKEIFYRILLPDLKARGKTVVAITHDDRYFHLADRLIKLEYGQVVLDERQNAPGASASSSAAAFPLRESGNGSVKGPAPSGGASGPQTAMAQKR
jgi:putative ATP-binding cassette transporter